MKKLILMILFLIVSSNGLGETVMENFKPKSEQIDQDSSGLQNENSEKELSNRNDSDLPTESIERISPYGKILIITNRQNSFTEGDYLSIVKNKQLISRNLSIKDKNGKAGIKVIKIYNVKEWQSLRTGEKIQIIKGDDSFYNNRSSSESKNATDMASSNEIDDISSEEDLLREIKGATLDEDKKRAIRTDNIISVHMGQISSLDNSGSSKKYTLWGADWEYQIRDNFWLEGSYGRSEMKDFPSNNANSSLNLYLLKVKYTVEAPYLFYIQPYLGYKYTQISSPPPSDKMTSAQKDEEKANIKDAEKKGFIFGVSVLKRLVPGWFFKANLGTDILSAGLGFEF